MKMTQKRTSGSLATVAVDQIKVILAENGTSIVSQSLGQHAIGMDSLNDTDYNTVEATMDSIRTQLRGTDLGKAILDKTSNQEDIELALDAAAYTIIASGDAQSMMKSFVGMDSAPSGTVGIDHRYAGEHSNVDWGMDGFDATSAQQYVAQSAYLNAVSMINSVAESIWFPTYLVPASQSGVDLTISLPKIYRPITRTVDGKTVPFLKTSIIDATMNPSVLDVEGTKVYPVVTGATDITLLADPAKVPNSVISVNGVDINSRPFAFGKQFDILTISRIAALDGTDAFDETDTLDPAISFGRLYFEAAVTLGIGGTPTTDTVVLSADLSTQSGARLTKTAEGTGHDYQLLLNASIQINNALSPVTGAAPAMVTALETLLGVGVGSAFTINAEVLIQGSVNDETGVTELFLNRINLTSATDATGTNIALSVLNSATQTLVLTEVGYTLEARRTNSNLRSRPVIIDADNTVTYRYPITMGSPLVSQSPIGMGRSVETLEYAQRVINAGAAVKSIMQLESVLAENNGVPNGHPAISAEIITPTYIQRSIDVAAVVNSLGSKDALNNLRGQLAASVTALCSELVLKSNYLAALETITGDVNNYEAIVMTDSTIASYLMESGDERTMGALTNFKIAVSLDNNIKGKIYISLRRKNRAELSPLDFGFKLVSPSLITDVQTTRGSKTVREQALTPRVNHYATLAILGSITVLNIDTIFTQ